MSVVFFSGWYGIGSTLLCECLVTEGDSVLEYKPVVKLGCRARDLPTPNPIPRILFITHSPTHSPHRSVYRTRASRLRKRIRRQGFPLTLRVRLVVTSNLHFDPDYRGLQQNSILLSSGVSG